MIEPKTIQAPEQVAEHYDELDRWYLAIWGEHVHHGLWLTGRESTQEATLNLVTRLAERLSIGPGARVCDIGCGYGATARVLAREYGASVTGLTLSEAQFIYSVEAGGEDGNPQILLMDFMDNGFDGDSFDAAISIESSEHFQDKPGLFEEIYRIVRPGGRVGIYAWLAKEGAADWQVNRLLEPICREGRLPGLGTEQDYRGWFTEAGFEGVRFEDYTKNVKRTWPVIVARCARRMMWDRSAWAYLFSGAKSLDFGKTIFRIWLSYQLGCMRYGLFTATKPESPSE